MFFDPAGKPLYAGKVVKELTFSPLLDTALPSWLVALGTSSIVTFGTMDTTQGYCRVQTKTSPASGDVAGVSPALNISMAQFEELSFVAYGVGLDSVAADFTAGLSFSSGGTGANWLANLTGTTTQAAPSSAVASKYNIGVSSKRMDLGITYRKKTGEVFFTTGDPYEGAGVVGYAIGNFGALVATPKLTMTTNTANQRYIQFEKLKLRLVTM